MKALASLALGSCLLGASLFARTEGAPLPGWTEQPPNFQANAPGPGQPIVLYFTAGWCGFCRQLERETLADPEVRAKLAPLARHKLDFDQHRGLVQEYGLRGVPVLLLVDAQGRELSRLTGFVRRETMLGWLAEGTIRTGEMRRAEEALAKELRGLPQQLQSPQPEERAAALSRLWQLAARGPQQVAQVYARQQLTKAIAANSEALFTGLAAPDLAVRIYAANLLRESSGGKSIFDPWAGADARAAAIAALREK